MKPRPIHIILLFAGVFVTCLGLQAQDRIPIEPIEERSNPPEVVQEESRPSIGHSQQVLIQSDTTYRATSIDSQGQRSGERPTAKNSEEDVLSFHFLYYIIQKFKMSDIVDK